MKAFILLAVLIVLVLVPFTESTPIQKTSQKTSNENHMNKRLPYTNKLMDSSLSKRGYGHGGGGYGGGGGEVGLLFEV